MSQPADKTEQMMRFFDGRLMPDEMLFVMSQNHEWFPTRPLSKSSTPRHLDQLPGGLPPLEIHSNDRIFDLYDYMATNQVCGLVVLKNGKLAFETYQRGIAPDTLWNSASIAKSFASTLVGMALAEGAIASLDDPLSMYLDLGDSPYSRVTILQLLQMTSGVRWNETYRDPASARRQLLDVQKSWTTGGIVAFMTKQPAEVPPGTRSQYNTGESYLVSAVLEAATGENMVDYMSDRLWSKIGMEYDARWWTESETGGMGISGSGMNAALRDYARFGQFFLEQGKLGDRALLPDGWTKQATTPFAIGSKTFPYGYMWWIPELDDPILSGSFQAEGIYGQYIHVNPAEELVVVLACARAKPSEKDRLEINDDAFFAAIARALRNG